ncbi:hypothetical protein BGX33_006266 [Mortierella sp. NVP41]|nr:hypothetical protein BGX33_006266 [Mortierella sp. NVP41]
MTSGPSPSQPVPVPPKKSTSTSASTINTATTPQPPRSVSAPLQSTANAEPTVLTSSSPVYSRAHPFLRKFQTTVQKAVAAQQQQNSAVLSSAFSTSAALGSSSSNDSSSKNKNNNNSVDEKIAAVSGGPPRSTVARKSPTLAAAKAADAIIQKRLEQAHHDHHHHHDHKHVPALDECVYTDQAFETSSAGHSHHGCGCGGDHEHGHGHDHDSDDDTRVEPSHFPPISEEAREFSDRLLGQNKAWARKTEQERPGFFAKLELQQKPQVLWIGCSDSRVPANQIVNLDPGEIFVHRNIANVVTHTDMNLLSVLEYAVDVLKVRHIIVCGHYGCGGVAASLTQKQFGVIDNWLRNIKDLYTIHRKKFDKLPHGGKEQQDLLTELNVIQSALNVCHTSIIQKAWSRGEKLSVHGWCYRLSDGVIRNLGLCIEGPGNVEEVYHVMDEHKSSK